MVIAHDFDYVRAASLDEALAALNAPGARVLAGGTDVVPWLRDDVIAPELLVDIKAISGLDAIGFDGERLHIGALVTFSDVMASDVVSERVPVLE